MYPHDLLSYRFCVVICAMIRAVAKTGYDPCIDIGVVGVSVGGFSIFVNCGHAGHINHHIDLWQV